MDALTATCLFSAPFAFLPGSLLQEYTSYLPTQFREVWTRDGLQPDETVVAWVPNPGQSFTIDDAALRLLPSLRIIATPSTGTNHIDREACAARGVQVFGLMDERPTLSAITASAEFTFLLLLNALRRLDVACDEADAGRWRMREDALRGHELWGRRVGVVGLGRIGERVARWSAAFEADVSFYDPYVEHPAFKRKGLDEIFSSCDVVAICAALTDETRGMIGGNHVRSLPRGAVLVNTARGELLRETEVADALRDRPDVGAAFDVLTGEVRGEQMSSPLWELQRKGQAVITPHIAGATYESQTKAALGALRLLQRHHPTGVLH